MCIRDREEVEQAKTEVGSIVYAQEYLAEFVEAGQGLLKPEWLRYFKEKNGRSSLVLKMLNYQNVQDFALLI